MRITSQSHLLNTLQYLRTSQKTLADAELEVATGRRVRTVSDDPTNAGSIMRIDQKLRATEQFRRNAAAVRTSLSVEEEVTTALRDLVEQARAVAIGNHSDDPTDPNRQAALDHVRTLVDQAISLGNTQVGSDHIFAGSETDTPPFLADGTYVGDSNVRQVEIRQGLLLDTNHTGDELFESSIQALQALATELEFGTGVSIQAVAVDLNAANADVINCEASLGLRMQEIEWADRHLARQANAMLDLREDMAQANPEESIVRFLAAQTALEQAREVISRIMQTSLTDHL